MARSVVALVVLVMCLGVLTLFTNGVDGKKQIDYDALERAWEAGDTHEELRSVGDEQFEALSSKSEEEAKALGPQMVFVTLREDRANAREPLAEVASRWKESLWNGGLDVTVYEIEQDKKLLVGLQRGVQAADLRRFLLEQPEVLEFEWDSKTYSPNNSNGEQHQHQHKKQKKAAGKKNKKSWSKTFRKKKNADQAKSTAGKANEGHDTKRGKDTEAQSTSTQQEPKSEL